MQLMTKPTNAEIEILGALWKLGPSTVKAVHEELQERREIGYTTVLKLMQIMAEKGLLVRDEDARAHVYRVAESQESTEKSLVADFVNRVFAGAAGRLAVQALGEGKVGREDLAEIRRLLDQLEGSDESN
jgi:predicted transcriptional regulator